MNQLRPNSVVADVDGSNSIELAVAGRADGHCDRSVLLLRP